jgi:small subunit ribosomal protein S16
VEGWEIRRILKYYKSAPPLTSEVIIAHNNNLYRRLIKLVKIRLRRIGAKKSPSYRIVVADSRAPRDGAFIAIIGHYNPLTDPETVVIDEEKALGWLKQGAQPTDTAARLLAKAGIIKESEARKEKMKAGTVAKSKASKKKARAGVTEKPEASKEEPKASIAEEPEISKEEPEASITEESATSEEPTETSEEKT